MMKSIVPAVFLCLLCLSCSTNNKRQTESVKPSTNKTPDFLPGKIYDNVPCLNNPEFSYSLYLPVGYNTDRSYPIIIFYDAHARGKLPVKKYQAIADKYKLILAGNNNSQNRQSREYSVRLSNIVLFDLKSKFSVNSRSVIVSGFSGGARVAAGLALSRFDFFGTIACGAANPGQVNIVNTSVCLAATTGDEDFNYLEIHKFFEQLNSMNISNKLFEFRGGHEWPPVTVFEKAIKFILLEAYRKNALLRDDKFIVKLFNEDKTYFRNYFNEKRYDSAWILFQSINGSYSGLVDLSRFQKKYKEKITSEYYDKSKRVMDDIFAREKELQTYYLSQLGEKSLDWWETGINKLNENRLLSSSAYVIKMYTRVLNYLSLASNIKASSAISNKNPVQAEYFLQVYEWVDPDNADVWFLKALNAALENKTDQVKANLERAVELNYSDLERLQNEPLLQNFQEEAWFKLLLNSLE